MKHIRLSVEDSKQLRDGWSVEVGCYILFNTPMGWDWGVNPMEAEWYDHDEDELDEYIEFDCERTEVVDDDEDDEEEDEDL